MSVGGNYGGLGYLDDTTETDALYIRRDEYYSPGQIGTYDTSVGDFGILPPGSNGYILTARPALSNGLAWEAPTALSLTGAALGGAQTAGSGLVFTPSTITGTGTIALAASGAAAGTYGSATQVAQITADSTGRATSLANVAISPITINTASPLSGGGSVGPGGTLNLTVSTSAVLDSIPTENFKAASLVTINAGAVGAVAIGHEARLMDKSVTLGRRVGGSAGTANVALGWETLYNCASASGVVAIGVNCLQAPIVGPLTGVVAVGADCMPFATSNNNTSIGYAANFILIAGANNSALGYSAGVRVSGQSNTTCVGYEAWAVSGDGGTAVGYQARANAASASAFGISANASGDSSIALGPSSTASAADSIAVGGAGAGGSAAVAIGLSASAAAVNTVAIGATATASSSSAVAIGSSASAAADSLALSRSATATGVRAQAIGALSDAISDESIALGYQASVPISSDAAIAIGKTASATGLYSISIGQGSSVSATLGVAIGSAAVCAGSAIAVGSAANAVASSISIGAASYATNSGNVTVGTSSGRYLGTNSTALGYQIAFNTATASPAPSQTIVGYQAGYNCSSGNGLNTLVGMQAGILITTGDNNTLVGAVATVPATSVQNVAVGSSSSCSASSGTALGYAAGAGSSAVAIGVNSSATASNSIAIGSGCVNSTANTALIGNSTTFIVRSAGLLKSNAWYSCKAGRSSGTQTVTFPGPVTITIASTIWTNGCAVSGNNITLPEANTQFSINTCVKTSTVTGSAIGAVNLRLRYYDGTTTTTIAETTLTTTGSTGNVIAWCCSATVQTPNVTTAYVFTELERLTGATTSVDISSYSLTVKRDA